MRASANLALLSCIWLVSILFGMSLRVAPPSQSLPKGLERVLALEDSNVATVSTKASQRFAGNSVGMSALLEVEKPLWKQYLPSWINSQGESRANEKALVAREASAMPSEASDMEAKLAAAEAGKALAEASLRESQDELAILRTQIEALQEECTCPITRDILQNPVMMSDGHTYEKEAARRWVAQRQTSPLTGLPLSIVEMTPNFLVARLARALRGNQGEESADVQAESSAMSSGNAQVAVAPGALLEAVIRLDRRACINMLQNGVPDINAQLTLEQARRLRRDSADDRAGEIFVGGTVLHLAAFFNWPDVCRLVLSTTSFQMRQQLCLGRTALGFAALAQAEGRDTTEAAEVLRQHGVQRYAQVAVAPGALLEAVIRLDRRACINMLQNGVPDINAQLTLEQARRVGPDDDGEDGRAGELFVGGTVLHLAAFFNWPDVCRLVLSMPSFQMRLHLRLGRTALGRTALDLAELAREEGQDTTEAAEVLRQHGVHRS